ncbi:GntR family transcriptional regulator [Bifidobacterium aquikefiricola]|uniref:GntR family transcriptional regulator n=1 Tax=Bifidobacterium aquikefiricola TaxID=3059038 RepID=A0AB39U6S9_9BIFI
MPEISSSSEPIFLALARIISNAILAGTYKPGSQVPSTNELATFFKINPITAGRALTVLTEQGILSKRRGVGTFVTQDAVALLRASRIDEFTRTFIDPLLAEAKLLGISDREIAQKIAERNNTLLGIETMSDPWKER